MTVSRFVFLFLHLSLCLLLLPHCGSGTTDQLLRKENDHVIIAVDARAESLDPRIGTSMASYRLQQLTFNYLINQGMDGELVNELVSHWERLPWEGSGEEIRFTLRSDVSFHDGSPLTAKDVAYTFNTLIDKNFISRKKGAFADLLEVEALGDFQVSFFFNRRQSVFFADLPAVGIIKAGSDSQNAVPIGSGPFIPTEKRGPELFIFHANGNYFLGAPEIQTLEIRVVPDNTTRSLEFMHGSVDLLINDVTRVEAAYLASLPGKKLVQAPGLAYQYIGLNHRHEILANLAVRRALSFAIDRDSLIQHFLGGLARKAESPMLPQLWKINPVFSAQEYNPQEAKHLLDVAGYIDPDGDSGPKTRFSLEFSCSNQRESREFASILQAMFAEVGIELKIKSSEWQTFYMDVVNGRYHLYSLRWVGIIDPSFFAAVFHSTSIPNEEPPAGEHKRGSLNRGRYINQEIDSVIEAAEIIEDETKRWLKYTELQQIIDRDLPYIDLWYADNIALMRDDLDGLRLPLNGSFASLRHLHYTSNK